MVSRRSSGRAGRAASPRALRARGCAALVARPVMRSPLRGSPSVGWNARALGFQPRGLAAAGPTGRPVRHAASFGTKLVACLTLARVRYAASFWMGYPKLAACLTWRRRCRRSEKPPGRVSGAIVRPGFAFRRNRGSAAYGRPRDYRADCSSGLFVARLRLAETLVAARSHRSRAVRSL